MYGSYTITTEVEHGSIDPTTKVGLQEQVTINFAPEAGYALKSIVVDGNPYYFQKPPESYTFKNVVSNHDIKVVYEKILDYQVIDVATSKEVTPKDVITNTPAVGNLIFDADGKSITSIVTNTDGSITIVFNDGTTITTDPIPAQPAQTQYFVRVGNVEQGDTYTFTEPSQTNGYLYRELLSTPVQGVARLASVHYDATGDTGAYSFDVGYWLTSATGEGDPDVVVTYEPHVFPKSTNDDGTDDGGNNQNGNNNGAGNDGTNDSNGNTSDNNNGGNTAGGKGTSGTNGWSSNGKNATDGSNASNGTSTGGWSSSGSSGGGNGDGASGDNTAKGWSKSGSFAKTGDSTAAAAVVSSMIALASVTTFALTRRKMDAHKASKDC